MQQAIAITLIILFCTLLLFQLLLAFGAPLGRAAWGGNYTVLSTHLRLGSFVSAVIFGIAILTVLDRINIISLISTSWPSTGLLFLFTGLFALSSLANYMSTSQWERLLMTPVALGISLLCLGLALSSS